MLSRIEHEKCFILNLGTRSGEKLLTPLCVEVFILGLVDCILRVVEDCLCVVPFLVVLGFELVFVVLLAGFVVRLVDFGVTFVDRVVSFVVFRFVVSFVLAFLVVAPVPSAASSKPSRNRLLQISILARHRLY